MKSVMMLAKYGMAGSGLGNPYWFCAATNGKDCRNVTFKNLINNTPWGLLYNEKRDISKFRPFKFWLQMLDAPEQGSARERENRTKGC